MDLNRRNWDVSYTWFSRLRMRPKNIWLTPKMTDIFILNELWKAILFFANCHTYDQSHRYGVLHCTCISCAAWLSLPFTDWLRVRDRLPTVTHKQNYCLCKSVEISCVSVRTRDVNMTLISCALWTQWTDVGLFSSLDYHRWWYQLKW